MKNIVVVCDYAYVEGGAAQVAIQTALAMSLCGDLNVWLLAGCGEPCEELQKSSVKTVSLHMPDLLGNPSRINAIVKGIYNTTAYRRITELFETLDPAQTVVNIHSWTKVLSSAAFRAAEKKGIPVFLTVHDYFLVCPNGGCYDYVAHKICERIPLSPSCIVCNCDARNYYHKVWRCVRQTVQNCVIRSAKNVHYIFISEFEKKQLLRRMPVPSQSTLIKNIISCGERYRIPAEQNHLYLFVGRVSEEKGIRLFCEAVHRAGVKAAAIGDGKLRTQLQMQYPDIIFTGWLSKEALQKWVDKARALLFTSLWYEGSPLTVPEVQAYGLPCIVTDCSSAIDNIQDHVNGILVNASVDAIVNAIDRMQSDAFIKELSENTYAMFDVSRYDKTVYIRKLRDYMEI